MALSQKLIDKIGPIADQLTEVLSAIEGFNSDIFEHNMADVIAAAVNNEPISVTAGVQEHIQVNVAADIMALAHSIYKTGDKKGALKHVVAAFEDESCDPLMEALAKANEEANTIVLANLNMEASSEIDNENDDDLDNTVKEVLSRFENPEEDELDDLGNTPELLDEDLNDGNDGNEDEDTLDNDILSPSWEEESPTTTMTDNDLGMSVPEDDEDYDDDLSVMASTATPEVLAMANKLAMKGDKESLAKAKQLLLGIQEKRENKAA